MLQDHFLSYLLWFAVAGQLHGDSWQVGSIAEGQKSRTGSASKHILFILTSLVAPNIRRLEEEEEEEEGWKRHERMFLWVINLNNFCTSSEILLSVKRWNQMWSPRTNSFVVNAKYSTFIWKHEYCGRQCTGCVHTGTCTYILNLIRTSGTWGVYRSILWTGILNSYRVWHFSSEFIVSEAAKQAQTMGGTRLKLLGEQPQTSFYPPFSLGG